MGSIGTKVKQGSQIVRSDVRKRCKGPVLKNRPNESVGLHVVEKAGCLTKLLSKNPKVDGP